MIQITAGNKYMDIDAYASCIAYAKLLNSLNIESLPVKVTKNLNKSIPKSFLNMDYKLYDNSNEFDDYIILDVSNPNMIDKTILDKHIIEVIDHHPYYEYIEYWKNKKTDLILEEIGSVCTIIYEKIKEHNKQSILDSDLCKLLIAGIVDNTLNLNASITKQRDIDAVKDLMNIGNISDFFIKEYFEECQNSYRDNIVECIEDDLKDNLEYKNIPKVFGQLLIANYDLIGEFKDKIIEYMDTKYSEWMINFILLEQGKSIILTDSIDTTNKIKTTLNAKVVDNTMIELPKFKLRKEIIKVLNEGSSQ